MDFTLIWLGVLMPVLLVAWIAFMAISWRSSAIDRRWPSPSVVAAQDRHLRLTSPYGEVDRPAGDVVVREHPEERRAA